MSERRSRRWLCAADVYVTNAVKHFKWYAQGKRRMHDKPRPGEVRACKPWLDTGSTPSCAIRPQVVVAPGVTAATTLLERAVTLKSVRGRAHSIGAGLSCWVTVHPSAILRAKAEDHDAQYAAFVADLRRVSASLARGSLPRPSAR